MIYSSFYKEKLYFMDEDNPNGANDKLQNSIDSLLCENLAVGIIGGNCDDNGSFSIKYISSFALNILNMNINDFKKRQINTLNELIWKDDRQYFISKNNAFHKEQVFRLLANNNRTLLVHAHLKTSIDEDNSLTWTMSIRSLEIISNLIMQDPKYILSEFLDLETQLLYVQTYSAKVHSIDTGMQCIQYDEAIRKMIDASVYNDFQHETYKRLNIHSIKNILNKNGTFEYVFPQKAANGRALIVRIKYRFVNTSKRYVFITCEDATELFSYDYVTKCLNKEGFLIKANEWILDNNQPTSIVYFNVNSFKTYNSVFGFEKGDELLSSIVKYIQESFLKPIYISRFESDHFICIVPTENIDISKLEKLCEFSDLNKKSDALLRMTCGIYHISKSTDNPENLREICKNAMLAEESIKENSTHSVCIYKQQFNEENLMSEELLENFDFALKSEQFKVYYQPIFDAKTKEISSAEALVRWDHPKYGLIPPLRFVPLLEKHNIIKYLDNYVSRKVLELLETRIQNGKKIVPLSINVSCIDLLDKNATDEVFHRIIYSKVPLQYCRMELTESVYLSLNNDTSEFLHTLHRNGIKILIDDFGCGYSSFASMTKYTFDFVKLDMQFAEMINKSEKANIVICSIIKMCHNLGIKVIAEGIENEEQFLFVQKNNCDFIQGFYFSKPLPQNDFEELLDN